MPIRHLQDEFGPNLPPELFDAILSRLPVESLLRFRCVCKFWRSLISHPKFVKTHLSPASINNDYTHHRLLIRRDYHTYDVKSCSLYVVLHEHSYNAVELDCPIKIPHRYWFGDLFVGCRDGLVCIAIEREVYIWNPSTGKSKSLPSACAITWRGVFVGCRDGLVCIAIEREAYIWNPSTRKSKSLPSARAITWRGMGLGMMTLLMITRWLGSLEMLVKVVMRLM
ncbi:F-box/kelch-repeat protein At3g23880-like [Rhododendron vialii]|uniref:F-box/kelch-repeat protein At3g23880-like n=1 Tax=Rhododendron vialii TaxID=182163 RepID=UPI00265EB565|nr:F-box/kelch-repeat protein At3g23880-like [Rhododendron vialii]